MTRRALLVEDDAAIATVITAGLEAEHFTVDRCDSIAKRDALLSRGEPYDVLLTDVVLTDGDGIAALGLVHTAHPGLPVIILSAQNTLDTAIRATETGAFEYFPKPFDLDELVRAARQAAEARDGGEQGEAEPSGGLPLVGRSPPMQDVFRMITRVLRNDLTVLILGESGTGKELVAEAIHEHGARKAGPFVAVNTAAIPSELIESELFGHEKGSFTGAVARSIGKFEQADGGTLFLDEIGDMPLEAQTRLLRALQSGTIRRVGGREDIRFDARIVAATNKDLAPLIAAGRFREDLFYRLNVVPIHLPALRERQSDIPALARHFLALAAAEGLPRRKFSAEAVDLLQAHAWRGNVRELRNFAYRAALLAREDEIDAASARQLLTDRTGEEAPHSAAGLDAALATWLAGHEIAPGLLYHAALAAFEKPLFEHALRQSGGNQLRAAHILGINRNTLRKRLDDLSIDPEAFAHPH